MKEKCIHCGNEALQVVYHHDKPFCCEGCVMVYKILNDRQLYDYYEIQDAPGIKDNSPAESYEYLDEESIKLSVLEFRDESICKINLYIPAIHCSSCIWLLEHLERLHSGILSSMVNFNRKKLTVSYDERKIKLSQLMQLLASIHYKAYIPKEKKHIEKSESRKLLIKLGIAGFAFGNVMLLSFPEYLSSDIVLNEALVNSFGWISIALSLPVMFYAASDYFMSAWKNLRKLIVSIDLPIAIGIIAIFARSLFEIISKSGAGYLDSLTGLVFFLLIGKWYQAKTYDALNFENDYTSYFPLGVYKVDGEQEYIVPVDQLEEGDLIRIKNGEIIPADSLLMSPATSVDYSFITGESVPVSKKEQELIYAGGRIIGQSVLLKVSRTVEAGYLASMWKEHGKNQSSVLSGTLDTVSRYFTIIVLLIATLTAVYWALNDPSKVIFAFTSVLIVACPCALALSIPFAFGHGRTFMGKKGFYLKKAEIIEQLHQSDTIVFDKTGTLTDPNAFELEFSPVSEKLPDWRLVRSVSMQSNHPLSRAVSAHLYGAESLPSSNFSEETGKGLQALCMGKKVVLGSAAYLGIEQSGSDNSTQVHLKIDHEYLGYFSIKNHYRRGWQQLLEDLGKNYELHLLSGDNDQERSVLNRFIPEKNLHFNQSPRDKLNYIKMLQEKKRKVLMAGDGLNDSGALKQSNTGISVADNIYLFAPSSDGIINASSLRYLPAMLKFSHSNMKVVYASFVLSFLYNIVGIYYASSGQLSPIIAAILMPLSSITVVAFTSLSTMYLGRKTIKKLQHTSH
ncbi:heavy metal translocating P-type ATPase [Roseimarinus sediminis]|uniref:heavy metal translocating P-type ATPase n=1 Tax=Roseimarinus sediminis TaxID=1610899 RepID=UPI003D2579F7